jgi:ElaB/YqjD/DUF883 family membrane-anchored ribosome-binding protein
MTSYNERTSRRRHARGSDFNMSVNGIMNMVTRKPEALLLVGAGLALLMRNGRGFSLSGLGTPSRSHGGQDHRDHRLGDSVSSRPGRYQPNGDDGSAWAQSSKGIASSAREVTNEAREALHDVRESAGQMASEATEGVTRYASDMMRNVSDTASDYASTAANYASTAGRWAEEARGGIVDRSHQLAERARSLPDELDEAVQEHPLVLAALGVAIGAALGASLPSTSIEKRTLGEASDQMWRAAETVTGRIGDAAEEAYDEAWRTAQEHGLSKDGLKDMARDVGAKFVSAAAGEAAEPHSSGGQSSSGATQKSSTQQALDKGGMSSGQGSSGVSPAAQRPGGLT